MVSYLPVTKNNIVFDQPKEEKYRSLSRYPGQVRREFVYVHMFQRTHGKGDVPASGYRGKYFHASSKTTKLNALPAFPSSSSTSCQESIEVAVQYFLTNFDCIAGTIQERLHFSLLVEQEQRRN